MVDVGLVLIEYLDYVFKVGSKDEVKIVVDFGVGCIDCVEVNCCFDVSFDCDIVMCVYCDFVKCGVFVILIFNGGCIFDFFD